MDEILEIEEKAEEIMARVEDMDTEALVSLIEERTELEEILRQALGDPMEIAESEPTESPVDEEMQEVKAPGTGEAPER